jgi:hypothetical protein
VVFATQKVVAHDTCVDKLCDFIHNNACGVYCGIYYYNLTLGYGAYYTNYKLSVMTQIFLNLFNVVKDAVWF